MKNSAFKYFVEHIFPINSFNFLLFNISLSATRLFIIERNDSID